jgi:hypothetical protein
VNTDGFLDHLTADDLTEIEHRLIDAPADASQEDTTALLSEVRRLRVLLVLAFDELDRALLACASDDEPVAFCLTPRATAAALATEETAE